MNLIIDIPEDVYTRLFDNGIQDNEIAVDDVREMARALRMGTPLDEGEYINKAELIKRMLGHINRFAEEKNFSMNEGLKYAQGVIVGMPTFAVPEIEKEVSE